MKRVKSTPSTAIDFTKMINAVASSRNGSGSGIHDAKKT
jgi:hypothetical protein